MKKKVVYEMHLVVVADEDEVNVTASCNGEALTVTMPLAKLIEDGNALEKIKDMEKRLSTWITEQASKFKYP